MKKFWVFISDPKTMAVLALCGGAVAFLWQNVEKHLLSSSSPVVTASPSAGRAKPSAPNEEAEKRDLPAPNAQPPGQRAEATNGGTAVNAGNNSTVTISH